jgi:ATP-dependent exoDNAse (exonuclease V) beta subunit
VLGLAVGDSPDECAAAVADEIVKLLRDGSVRDKTTGVPRRARPGDIAILFRSRTSHREFERELGARGVPTYVYKGLGFFDADEIKDLSALIRYLADPWSSLRAAAFLRSRFLRLSDRGVAALAPDLAAVLLAAEEPASLSLLDEEDRRVVEHARRHVPAWLAAVDRTTPAELVDHIIEASAYAFELRGGRQRQAWENVKKMRGLVRRIQNRGYATIPRIAEHLKALTAGDESNAVVEAIDAVNLMTVHASKGLEFPVVFLVNLARGASGPPRPVRVVVGAPTAGEGAAESVTVGSFLSETDEAERARERHETRRLLYVAVTRARDRLYLSSTLKEGVHVPGRGSLAEVLPESITALFGRAASAFDELDTLGWTGASGHAYAWRLCRPGSDGQEAPVEMSAGVAAPPGATAPPAVPVDRFGPPAADPGRVRVPATRAKEEDAPAAGVGDDARSSRVLGRIIHRLFERAEQFVDPVDPADVVDLAARLVRPEEQAAAGRPETLSTAAAQAFMSARGRPDVRRALEGAERFHEVPFSLLTHEGGAARIVRGTIDCLVRKSNGTLLVVELKTGRRQPAHDDQLAIYVRAARALYPDTPVEGVVLYV